MKNIILCGFMGSGKSTVGKALAALLNRRFIDMDDYIEQHQNKKIPAIFAESGEAGFRKLEHDAVREIAAMAGLVVATGGGALTRPENVQAFRQSSVTVYLNADFNTCYSRIKGSDRPLVQKYSRAQLEQIYDERSAVYRGAAEIEIAVSSNQQETAEKIAARVAGNE